MAVAASEVSAAMSILRRKASPSVTAYLLAAPGAFALLTLFLGPALAVFFIALTDWELGSDQLGFVGLANFRTLLLDPQFIASATNTVVYTLLVVPISVALGLTVALLIDSGRSLRAFYRAAHFLPVMATMAAMAIAWEALLHPTIGAITQFLAWCGVPTMNWLRNEHTVLFALATIGVWQNFGYAMVLFLAGLKMIPQDLYEAAAVDGADSTLERLRTVTLPMLGPTLMFVSIVVTLRSIEVFDTVSILTKGGPGTSSEVMLYSLYRESFLYLQTGYGAAIAVVFLLDVTVLTLIQARTMDRKVHYT